MSTIWNLWGAPNSIPSKIRWWIKVLFSIQTILECFLLNFRSFRRRRPRLIGGNFCLKRLKNQNNFQNKKLFKSQNTLDIFGKYPEPSNIIKKSKKKKRISLSMNFRKCKWWQTKSKRKHLWSKYRSNNTLRRIQSLNWRSPGYQNLSQGCRISILQRLVISKIEEFHNSAQR